MSTVVADAIRFNPRNNWRYWQDSDNANYLTMDWRFSIGDRVSFVAKKVAEAHIRVDSTEMRVYVGDNNDGGPSRFTASLDHTGYKRYPITEADKRQSKIADDGFPVTTDTAARERVDTAAREGDLYVDALQVTDGAARIYARCDLAGVRLLDASGQVRVQFESGDDDGGFAMFQSPTDADPGLWEFLQISKDLIGIGTFRPGSTPEVKCLLTRNGVTVFSEARSIPELRRPIHIGKDHGRAEATVLEAQTFLVGSRGRLDENGFQFKSVNGNAVKVGFDGMIVTNVAGTCRKVCIKWDGIYFFDASNALLRKLTANGVE